MKIHTTQNLNSLVQNQQSTNRVSAEEFRLKNYSEQLQVPGLSAVMRNQGDNISFEGKKKVSAEDAKKIIKASKKFIGDIKKEPKPEVKRGDRFLNGSFFNWVLSKSKFEPVIQAGLAAVVCMILRPLTIMSLPSKEGSQDNAYAASHSFASGLAGLLLTTPLTLPFKHGADYAKKELLKDMSAKTLKRLNPHIDLKSIVDKNGKRIQDMDLWKDIDGNKFSEDIKGVAMLPEFRQLADVSTKTFETILGIKDVDWLAHKGKSFNEVKLKNGKSLYESIKMDRLGIVVEEEGFERTQILLKDLDHEYLEKLIKDSSENNWGKLDINSVYADKEKNIVKDFRKWKSKDGKAWKLDLDQIFVSSELETAEYRPRRTGAKRYDKKEKEYKFVSYQNNASKEDALGTKIDNAMVEAGLANEGQMKLLTWLPDLAFRIPIAVTTIALIPWSLKNIFHIDKVPKKQDTNLNQNSITVKNEELLKNEKEQSVSFKGGKKNPKQASWFVKWLGKHYGQKIMESEAIHKHSGKLANLPGDLTAHMATLGSFITSSVYVQQTLNKKDLDTDKRRTLAINQILCFFIPTALGYYVNNKINNWVKNKEYRYTGLQRYKQAMAKAEGKPYTAEQLKVISEKTKGIKAFASLLVFTAIYRYISPVAITPVANMIGAKVNAKPKEKTNKTEFKSNYINDKESKHVA